MNNMIERMIQKTGLKSIEYHLKRNKALKQPSVSMSTTDAINLLEKHSSNPKTSCIDPKVFKDEYDLEIIIPAFNVEKYINQCIESVLNQKTEFTYHITCIDDGSTDRTGQILDQYKEDKLSIIHQQNRGFSGARNRGLYDVKGKYIMFLDSDDFIPQGTIQNLLACAFSNNADIVEGGVIQCSEKGGMRRHPPHKEGKIESFSGLTGYPFAKVYRNFLFTKVSFPENYWYEDSLIRQIIYPNAKTIYGIDVPVYCRRNNPLGITNTGVRKNKSIDALYVTLSLFEDRVRLGMEIDRLYYEYILRMAKLIYLRTKFQPEEVKQAVFVILSDFVNREFQAFYTKKNDILEYALKNKKYELYVLWCEK